MADYPLTPQGYNYFSFLPSICKNISSGLTHSLLLKVRISANLIGRKGISVSFHLCFSYQEQHGSETFQTSMFIVIFFCELSVHICCPFTIGCLVLFFLLGDLYILSILTISNTSRKCFSSYHLCFYLFTVQKFLDSSFKKINIFSVLHLDFE